MTSFLQLTFYLPHGTRVFSSVFFIVDVHTSFYTQLEVYITSYCKRLCIMTISDVKRKVLSFYFILFFGWASEELYFDYLHFDPHCFCFVLFFFFKRDFELLSNIIISVTCKWRSSKSSRTFIFRFLMISDYTTKNVPAITRTPNIIYTRHRVRVVLLLILHP